MCLLKHLNSRLETLKRHTNTIQLENNYIHIYLIIIITIINRAPIATISPPHFLIFRTIIDIFIFIIITTTIIININIFSLIRPHFFSLHWNYQALRNHQLAIEIITFFKPILKEREREREINHA